MAWCFSGKTKELKWDKKIILTNTKRQRWGLPTRSRRPSSSSDKDGPLDPKSLLAEEDLPEDTSDESFHDLEEAVPTRPQAGPQSIMTAPPPGQAEFNVEDSLQENEGRAAEEEEEEEDDEEKEEEEEEGDIKSYKT